MAEMCFCLDYENEDAAVLPHGLRYLSYVETGHALSLRRIAI